MSYQLVCVEHSCSSTQSLNSVLPSIVTCYAILALLDKDGDPRARHELLNTEIILQIFQIGAEI